jgi:hypothetical protein
VVATRHQAAAGLLPCQPLPHQQSVHG